MTYQISQKGVDCIAFSESCKLVAYKDGGGVWTIGYGHTGSDAYQGNVITKARALELFKKDLGRFEDVVNRGLDGAPTTQDQFDAMVSLAFNIGPGGFAGSTVLRLHKAGRNAPPYPTPYKGLRAIAQNMAKPDNAADAFMMWVKDNGVLVAGLANRRLRERELYLGRDWTKADRY